MKGLIQYPDTPVPYVDPFREEILHLLQHDAYKHGDYTLSSGRKSEHYVNCKPVTLNGKGIGLISPMILDHIPYNTTAVAGLTLGADPLVTGVAMSAYFADRELQAIIVRKEPKGHGTNKQLEGPLPPQGSTITVLEDVTTTGASALKAVNVLRDNNYTVSQVISIVDRQEEECYNLFKQHNIEYTALFTLEEVSNGQQNKQ